MTEDARLERLDEDDLADVSTGLIVGVKDHVMNVEDIKDGDFFFDPEINLLIYSNNKNDGENIDDMDPDTGGAIDIIQKILIGLILIFGHGNQKVIKIMILCQEKGKK